MGYQGRLKAVGLADLKGPRQEEVRLSEGGELGGVFLFCFFCLFLFCRNLPMRDPSFQAMYESLF